MRPPPWRRMCGTTARQPRYVPITLISFTARHSSTGISSNGRIGMDVNMPALLTRMSTRPVASIVVSTIASMSPGSETSAVTPMPSGYRAAASSAPARSAITRRAPARAKPSAMARPIPWEPPVTMAV